MGLSDAAEFWDRILDRITGNQTETFDMAPEVQRPYGMPTGPRIPNIPLNADDKEWQSISESASRVCQSTTEDYRRTYSKPLVSRRWVPAYLGVVIAFLVMVVGCVDISPTQTITPQAAPAQLAETPQAPQLNPVREAMIAVQVTATANRLLGEALDREIIAGNATIAAQITLDAAYQSAQIQAAQATQSAQETAVAIPPQQTGTALALQGTQAAQTPTAVANADLVLSQQRKATQSSVEAWAAPAKQATQDIVIPVIIWGGLIIVLAIIATYLAQAKAYAIRLYAERTAPPPAHVYQYDDPNPGTPCANGNGTHGARTGDEFVEIDLDYARSMLAGRPVGEKLPGVNTVPGKEYDNMLKLMDECGVVEVRPNVGTFYRGDKALYTALRMLGQGRAPSLVKDYIDQEGRDPSNG